MKQTIWLVGNKGMLGSDVEKALITAGHNVWGTDKEIDITNVDDLKKQFINSDYDWIVNCAAYTDVNKAEIEREKAIAANDIGAENLAKIAHINRSRLIHISTDYVFNGEKSLSQMYTETDEPRPINFYGKTKLEGEKNIIKNMHRFFILRTSWLYGGNGKNFVNTMLKLFKEKDSISIVNDQHGAPTYTKDLAFVIEGIISRYSDKYGIYNVVNHGGCTWYDFAKYIYNGAKIRGLINNEVEIKPISSSEYKTLAARPTNSGLSTHKLRKEMQIIMRDWDYALDDCLNELQKGE